jgi:hypothetical protein
MTLALIASVVIALVVFAFVLEPILRARGDQVTLDELALPLAPAEHRDGDGLGLPEPPPPDEPLPEVERPAARATLDRPAGSDAT